MRKQGECRNKAGWVRIVKEYEIAFTTYNDSQEIIAFLENICAQTLPPKRIVMADGGSADDTVCRAKDFQQRSPVPLTVLTSEKRQNISQGFNTAIRATGTEYVGIVAVGNLYDGKHFEKLMERLLETGTDIAYPYLYGQETTDFSKWYNSYYLDENRGHVGKTPSNHGALLKRSVFERIGYFHDDLSVGEDTEFYGRAMRRGISVQAVREAKVYWKTPQSFGELCKQVNWYTIGDMRIFPNWKILWIRKKKFLTPLLVLAIVLCGLLRVPWQITAGPLAAFILCLLRFMRFGLKGALYGLALQFLSVFCLIKNCKYFCKSNKIENAGQA